MPRILVLEDYEPLARALCRTLRAGCGEESVGGAQVILARTCEQARMALGWFDLGIIDLELPDGSGIDVASDLLHEGRVGEITFFTACRDGEQIRAAAQLGRVVDKGAGVPFLLATLQRDRDAQSLQRAVGDDESGSGIGRGSSGRSGTRRIGS